MAYFVWKTSTTFSFSKQRNSRRSTTSHAWTFNFQLIVGFNLSNLPHAYLIEILFNFLTWQENDYKKRADKFHFTQLPTIFIFFRYQRNLVRKTMTSTKIYFALLWRQILFDVKQIIKSSFVELELSPESNARNSLDFPQAPSILRTSDIHVLLTWRKKKKKKSKQFYWLDGGLSPETIEVEYFGNKD